MSLGTRPHHSLQADCTRAGTLVPSVPGTVGGRPGSGRGVLFPRVCALLTGDLGPGLPRAGRQQGPAGGPRERPARGPATRPPGDPSISPHRPTKPEARPAIHPAHLHPPRQRGPGQQLPRTPVAGREAPLTRAIPRLARGLGREAHALRGGGGGPSEGGFRPPHGGGFTGPPHRPRPPAAGTALPEAAPSPSPKPPRRRRAAGGGAAGQWPRARLAPLSALSEAAAPRRAQARTPPLNRSAADAERAIRRKAARAHHRSVRLGIHCERKHNSSRINLESAEPRRMTTNRPVSAGGAGAGPRRPGGGPAYLPGNGSQPPGSGRSRLRHPGHGAAEVRGSLPIHRPNNGRLMTRDWDLRSVCACSYRFPSQIPSILSIQTKSHHWKATWMSTESPRSQEWPRVAPEKARQWCYLRLLPARAPPATTPQEILAACLGARAPTGKQVIVKRP